MTPTQTTGALVIIVGVVIAALNLFGTPQSIVVGGILVLAGVLVFLAADDKDKL